MFNVMRHTLTALETRRRTCDPVFCNECHHKGFAIGTEVIEGDGRKTYHEPFTCEFCGSEDIEDICE